MIRQVARAMLPRRARLAVSNLLSDRTSRRVRRELAEAAAKRREIVVGPWLGEVGFELLYWVPFLQWAVDAAGLEPLRMYDLRHTAVAFWIEAGASPNEIAQRAGHTSVAVVLDHYGHLFPSAQERTAEALDALFEQGEASGSVVAFERS